MFAVLATWVLATWGLAGGAMAAEKVWVLESDHSRGWCAYRNQDRWIREAAVRSGNRQWGTVAFEKGALVSADLTIEGQSGDWVVEDRYRIVAGGMTLERTYRLIRPWLRIVERYSIRAGEVRRVSSSTFNLDDGRPVKAKTTDFPDNAIIGGPEDFPFRRVAARARRGEARACDANARAQQ